MGRGGQGPLGPPGPAPAYQARIQDFLQGGGVNDGRVLRAPLAPAPTGGGGGSRVDKHQIKVHSVHRIFRAIFFDFIFLLVKKFVEKKNGGREQGGGGSRPPPPPGSAPAYDYRTLNKVVCVNFMDKRTLFLYFCLVSLQQIVQLSGFSCSVSSTKASILPETTQTLQL